MRLMVIAIAFSALVGALGAGNAPTHAATVPAAGSMSPASGHVIGLPAAK